MTTQHTSEPSKLVIAGSSYHVNAGTIRTLVEQRDEMLAALRDVTQCLENWIEIADEEDRRKYDDEALARARAAIAKATEVQS